MGSDERLLVIVSDLHCGSTVGLCPPDCPLLDDGCWTLNPIQQWIWDRWLDFNQWVDDYTRGRPFVLLANGDLTEGVHHRTVQVIHADPGVHARVAIDVLAPLAAKASRRYVVRGTGCHVGHSGEHSIGRTLRAASVGGAYSLHHWLFRVAGQVVSAKHHIGATSRRALRASALSINLEEELSECYAAGWEPPSLIVRSHRHTFGHYATEDAQIVVTPAWQCLTEHGWKVVPNAIPRVGGVIVDWTLSDKPTVVPKVWAPERMMPHE